MEKYITKLKQITKLKPKIKPKILISLFTFVAIISTLSYVGYRILRDGIYAQHFSIAGINIEGLYLKLENKLILDIQKLDLSHPFSKEEEKLLTQEQNKQPSELPSIDSIMGYVKDGLLVLSYFETLNVHNIVLPDNKVRKILYDGNLYQIYEPNFESILSTKNNNGTIQLEIQTLNIYPLNIQVDGHLEYTKKNLSFNLLATYEKNLQSLRVVKQDAHIPASIVTSNPQSIQNNLESNTDSNIIFAPPPHLLSPPPPHAQVQRSQYHDIHNATKPTIAIIGSTNFKNIELEVQSSELDSLNFLEQYLKPLNNKELEEWLFKRISFESAKINSFTLRGMLNDKFFNNLSKQMRAKAIVKNIKVAVAPKVEPIRASSVYLSLEDGFLDIAPQEPTFNSHSIKDSSVKVRLPFNNPLEVFVKIRSTKIALGQPLIDLLKFYGIDIPIQTTNDSLSASVDIHLRVANHIVEPQLVKGAISGDELNLLFLGEKIFAKDLGVKIYITPKEQNVAVASSQLNYNNILSTSLMLDIYPLQAKIDGTLKPTKIDIDINKIAPKPLPKSLNLTNTHDELTKNIIQAIIKEQQRDLPSLLQKNASDVVSQTNEKLAKLQKDHNKDEINKPNPLPQTSALNLNDFPPLDEITLNGSIKKGGFALHIPKLALNINKDTKENSKDSITDIEIENLALLYPYSPVLQHYGFRDGSVRLLDNGSNTLNINIALKNLNYPIYTKKGELLQSITMSGTMQNEHLQLATQDKKIEVIKRGNLLQFRVKDYDLNVEEMFSSNIPILRENLESESKELSEVALQEERLFIQKKQHYEKTHGIKPSIVQLETQNTNVIYDYVIPTDEITMTLRSGRIDAQGRYGNGFLEAEIIHGKANIILNNLNPKFINAVMNKKVLADKGVLNLNGTLQNKVFKGQMDIQNSAFTDFILLQNLLSIVNSLDNLVAFRRPGFSKDGFEVKNGRVNFYLNDSHLGLEKIDIVGSEIDIEGGGFIDLKKKTINLSLKASTMKTIAKAIQNTPLLGYVILGDDGKISTNIVVSGPLDDPKADTTIVEDIIKVPFEMIKRTFNLLQISN